MNQKIIINKNKECSKELLTETILFISKYYINVNYKKDKNKWHVNFDVYMETNIN